MEVVFSGEELRGYLSLAGPMIFVFVFAVLAMIVPFVPKLGNRRDSAGQLAFAVIGVVFAFIVNVLLYRAVAVPTTAFAGMLAIDGYALFVHFVILLAAMGALFVGHDYLRRVDVQVPEYYSLVLFAAFGMMLLAASNDLIMLFVSLEVMSVALYVLVAINRGEWKGVEGAFKYLILGAFTSAIMLYGVAFIYGATGATRLDFIAAWLADGHSVASDPIMAVGLALLLVGFAFKVAAVPFHMWSPDVYQGAPVPITTFMATGVKAAAFAAFGRVMFVAFLSGKVDWVMALWIMSAATILVGNTVALVQTDLKRMLAYSSIAHAGYLLMALVAVPETGLYDNPRVSGLLFYLLTYTIMNVGAFAAVSMLTADGADDTRIDRLSGLASRQPGVAVALSICLLSLAGIPPTMGFVGKFYLFASAVEGGYTGLAVVGAIGGAIGVYYYLRPIVLMYMGPTNDEAPASVSRGADWTLRVSAALLLALGLLPGPVIDWARESLMSLWGG